MYIDIGRTASATASLKVSLASGSSAAKWNILTRQIECDTKWTAPDGNTLLPSVNALYTLLLLVTFNYLFFLPRLLDVADRHNRGVEHVRIHQRHHRHRVSHEPELQGEANILLFQNKYHSQKPLSSSFSFIVRVNSAKILLIEIIKFTLCLSRSA